MLRFYIDNTTKVLGNSSWDWTGGFYTTFSYKGFRLSAAFDVKVGAGIFGVHADEYVDPGVTETTIWEGAKDIDWGNSNVQLTPDLFADVPVGATIVLHYEMIEADYHALRVCNFDWQKDFVAQVDAIDTKFPDSYEFTYTDEFKSYMDEGNMVITGFGYQLTKVTVK